MEAHQTINFFMIGFDDAEINMPDDGQNALTTYLIMMNGQTKLQMDSRRFNA